MIKKNTLAGWANTGLFPFNPDRVLRGITKPADKLPPTLSIPTANAACYQQREFVQTPVTPVSSEALASLLALIKQDPHDDTVQSATRVCYRSSSMLLQYPFPNRSSIRSTRRRPVVAIFIFTISLSITYDHRTMNTLLPVRSADIKHCTGGLVVRWVTTSEYLLLYVFVNSAVFSALLVARTLTQLFARTSYSNPVIFFN
jgi:hypothetical protein